MNPYTTYMMDIACSSTRNWHYTMVPSQAILLLWLPVFLVRPDFQSGLCLVKVTVSHQAIYERDRPKGTLHSLRGQAGTMWVFSNSTVDENLLSWHNECWHKMITNPQGNQLQNPSYICEMLIIKKQKKTSVDLQNVWREIICTRPQVLVTKIKKYLFPTSCWGHREGKIFSRDFVLRSRSNKSICSWPNVEVTEQ